MFASLPGKSTLSLLPPRSLMVDGLGWGVLEFLGDGKLGIYRSVPFCPDEVYVLQFSSGVVSAARFAPYAEAVCSEIRGHRELLKRRGWIGFGGRGAAVWAYAGNEREEQARWANGPLRKRAVHEKGISVDTVYFGGGTPSLLDPAHLQGILKRFRESFATEPCEVTLEADPETIAWKRLGRGFARGLTGLVLGCIGLWIGIGCGGTDAPAGGHLPGGADFGARRGFPTSV